MSKGKVGIIQRITRARQVKGTAERRKDPLKVKQGKIKSAERQGKGKAQRRGKGKAGQQQSMVRVSQGEGNAMAM